MARGHQEQGHLRRSIQSSTCAAAAAKAPSYEFWKMYEWYGLMVRSLQVQIHNKPLGNKWDMCLRTTKRQDFFFFFFFSSMKASSLISPPKVISTIWEQLQGSVVWISAANITSSSYRSH